MIGPLTLTVGQPYKLMIPRDSRSVTVQVDSQYDVFVSFKMVAPPVVSVSNGEWDDVVRRGHTSTIPVYGQVPAASGYERSRNALAQFQGTMWLLSTNPGGLAQTGTVSGRNNVYVTPLSPYDPMPVHAALSTQHDITSQPRVIAVPISQSYNYNGHNDFSAAGTYNPFPSPLAIPPNGQNTWNDSQPALTYIYFLSLAIGTGSASPTWAQVYVNLIETDGSLNQLASHTMHQMELRMNSTNGTGEPYVFTPAFPQSLKIQPGNTTAYLLVQLQLAAASTYPCRIYYNIGMDVDTKNATTVPAIGGGLEGYWNGAGSAPLY